METWQTISLVAVGALMVIGALIVMEVVGRRRQAADTKLRAGSRRRFRRQWTRSGQRDDS